MKAQGLEFSRRGHFDVKGRLLHLTSGFDGGTKQ